jgi:DNA-binding LacI/PurR family transcriptional regulator
LSVTAAEVARRAGVSQATVSYVLNDKPGQTISPKTRDRVLRAARHLGYRPNAAARSLRTGRGEAVLFPLPIPQTGHVLSQLISSCSDALTERGLTLVTDVTRYNDLDEQLDAWLRVRPAAVVDLLLAHDDPVIPALRKAGVIVLSAMGSTEPSAVEESWVSSGDVFALEARKTQLGYLIERGHRRIALLVPPRGGVDRRVERRAMQQLRAIAGGAGLKLETYRASLTAEGIREQVDAWLQDGLPDAVCAVTDDYAIAVISSLTARGIAVPAQVAVIGVDDTPAASYTTPSVTTIAADFDELAEAIADAVTSPIEVRGPLPAPGHHLVVRESA